MKIHDWDGTLPLYPGAYRGVPSSVYHSADVTREPALSSSIARLMTAESPLHAAEAHPKIGTGETPDDDSTEASKRGEIIHDLILGGGRGFFVLPEEFKDFRKKAAQELRDKAIAEDEIPVLAHKMAEYQEIASKILDRVGVSDERELTLIWEDEGVLCKSRLDIYDESRGVRDLKTVATCNVDFLRRKVVSEGMDIQAYSYARSVEVLYPALAGRVGFEWIFAEMKRPFDLCICSPSGTTLEMGRRRWELARDAWRDCLASGDWPGRQAVGRIPSELDPPEWEIARMTEVW